MSGVPQPVQRFQKGSEPSFQAIRTAFAHGANCVMTSLRLGLCVTAIGATFQGGYARTWSSGMRVRSRERGGDGKTRGMVTNGANEARSNFRPSVRATKATAPARTE